MNVPAVAEAELARWAGLTETEPAAEPILEDYWSETGLPYVDPSVPWSAAFVSWVVAHSDVPDALTRSGAHVLYARQAYLDRGKAGRYGAFDPAELLVEPGDIIVRGRDGNAVTLESLSVPPRKGGRPAANVPAHGSIVVEATPLAARVVGGNVNDTVSETTIPLVGGKVADPAVVLRYQSRPGTAVPLAVSKGGPHG